MFYRSHFNLGLNLTFRAIHIVLDSYFVQNMVYWSSFLCNTKFTEQFCAKLGVLDSSYVQYKVHWTAEFCAIQNVLDISSVQYKVYWTSVLCNSGQFTM